MAKSKKVKLAPLDPRTLTDDDGIYCASAAERRRIRDVISNALKTAGYPHWTGGHPFESRIDLYVKRPSGRIIMLDIAVS